MTEIHRYHLNQAPPAAPRAALGPSGHRGRCRRRLDRLREKGRSEKTVAGVLATLQTVMRFAVRNGWTADSPVGKLESDE